MPFFHVVVWLDHARADVLYFRPDETSKKTVKAPAAHSHSNGHHSGNSAYFREIAEALAQCSEILIVGPGREKLAFAKYLEEQQPEVSKKVVGVETVDHPSEGQLLAYARKYFLKADLYR
jgi:stalled ribosome rescue protein Dom34